MPIKIKFNKQIQNEVDKRQSHKIYPVAEQFISALAGEDPDHNMPQNKVAIGFNHAISLINKFQRKYLAASTGPRRYYPDVLKTFGIYLAEQNTDDGTDKFYFIGIPSEIVKKLKKIPEDVDLSCSSRLPGIY